MIRASHFAIFASCRAGSNPAWYRFSEKVSVKFLPSQLVDKFTLKTFTCSFTYFILKWLSDYRGPTWTTKSLFQAETLALYYGHLFEAVLARFEADLSRILGIKMTLVEFKSNTSGKR